MSKPTTAPHVEAQWEWRVRTLLDKNGDPIFISSFRMGRKNLQRLRSYEWWPEVAGETMDKYATEAEARRTCAERIRNEKPRYNRVNNPDWRRDEKAHWVYDPIGEDGLRESKRQYEKEYEARVKAAEEKRAWEARVERVKDKVRQKERRRRREYLEKQKTWELYRHYDSEWGLLYVGISGNEEHRRRQHRVNAVWWPERKFTISMVYPSREAVLEAELEAIRAENPRYNIAGRVSA